MDLTHLASFLKQSEVRKRILGSYSGVYSMGITLDPANENQAAICVHIEGADSTMIADQIVLADQIISIIVKTQFSAPRAQANS